MNLSEEYISKYATLKAIEKELDEIPNGWIEHRSYKLEHDYYRVSETSLKKYEEGEDISRIIMVP